jgi:para-aminobenzoate synthetase/4-amino-4-deoxychorismate lyase
MSFFIPASDSDTACFALLDDSDVNAGQQAHSRPHSRLYSGYLGSLRCMDAGELRDFFAQLQQQLDAGKYAVALFSYELGAAMHQVSFDRDRMSSPLAEILLFAQCEHLDAARVSAWLAAQDEAQNDTQGNDEAAGIAAVHAQVGPAEFEAAIARIQNYIRAGDTYQVNYTYRYTFDAYGSLPALYRRLRARQPVPYGALISLPDGRAVLSLSPELFVRKDGKRLTARPMKGTAAASGDAQQDGRTAQALAGDQKNRAENLMIVDLLRNDLGRIAATGSVAVERLFDVQRYSSVLQMTSTVHAQMRDDVSLFALFSALYPCGSITGAPKHRTMQIIREIEVAPRGIYTGALGWFDPPLPGDADPSCGDFCLSVPIRTLELRQDGRHFYRGEMGVGAGIVYDSVAASEYEECRLKASFLTAMRSEFELFETMHATRAEGCRYLDRHLARLRKSAAYFDFKFDEAAIRVALHTACQELEHDGAHRMRLALQASGEYRIQSAVLPPLATPVRILLADRTTAADDLFLRHKTTIRTVYDQAWRAAEQAGAFDQLFCNQSGQLTEGGRSTLFVKLDGVWCTPPLSAGVLPGIMRSVLLDDPAWHAQQRNITLDDLRQAQEIVVCSALRGVLAATIVWDAGT